MSIWSDLENLSDSNLRMLTHLTAETLFDFGDMQPEFPPDFLSISPLAASRQLEVILGNDLTPQSNRNLLELFEDQIISRDICLKILTEVKQYSDLASYIEEQYLEKIRKMPSPELVILSSALVILAIKIKEINLTKKKKKITFYESSESIKSFISNLLGDLRRQ